MRGVSEPSGEAASKAVEIGAADGTESLPQVVPHLLKDRLMYQGYEQADAQYRSPWIFGLRTGLTSSVYCGDAACMLAMHDGDDNDDDGDDSGWAEGVCR